MRIWRLTTTAKFSSSSQYVKTLKGLDRSFFCHKQSINVDRLFLLAKMASLKGSLSNSLEQEQSWAMSVIAAMSIYWSNLLQQSTVPRCKGKRHAGLTSKRHEIHKKGKLVGYWSRTCTDCTSFKQPQLYWEERSQICVRRVGAYGVWSTVTFALAVPALHHVHLACNLVTVCAPQLRMFSHTSWKKLLVFLLTIIVIHFPSTMSANCIMHR